MYWQYTLHCSLQTLNLTAALRLFNKIKGVAFSEIAETRLLYLKPLWKGKVIVYIHFRSLFSMKNSPSIM